MKVLSFRGGVHPRACKDISIMEPLRTAPLPHIAVVPLSQHIGEPNKPVVNKGDDVEEGQVLGRSDSFVSSPVHSPVYGKVRDIKKAFHPTLGPVMSVFVERDESREPRKYTEKDTGALSAEELIEKVRDAGIVGMGGAAFPTHVKLRVPEGRKIKTLIINGAECEPYLTCDHVLMTHKTREILSGIEILIRILGPGQVYMAIEDNKKAAIFAFQKLIKETRHSVLPRIRIIPFKTKYPQGGEKQLIKAISGQEVPPGKLPLDIGFLVHNVGTVHAIYEAVYYDKPLIERVVTISGDCMHRPGDFVVRIGATIRDIVEQYGIELYKDPKKVIVGGPMMGFAQPHMEAPILKSTSGILFLSDIRAEDLQEGNCIKCARCVDVCPVNLVPTEIAKVVKKGFWEKLDNLHVTDCMECGACAYTCPARIPLVQYIKDAKNAVTEQT
ncbi:MAG: electron transport complex subunit RsxC [Candidatus Omnitrophota bacterium]|nr:electron transport complex subunit RsxC [Candidatus Omnitrophota bacterium]